MRVVVALLALVVVGALSCEGCNGPGTPNPPGPGGDDAGGAGSVDSGAQGLADGGAGGGDDGGTTITVPPGSVAEGGDCQNAVDCMPDLVCDPSSDTCEGDVVCDIHSDCGPGAVCASDAVCTVDPPGTGGGDVGDDCATTGDCSGALVCDPGTSECATDVECTTHGDCGSLAYCTQDGACAPSSAGTPCDTNLNCIFDEYCFANICVPDGCVGEQFQAERVPPNMLIVLDRSSSMNETLNNSGGLSKWDVAKTSIDNLLVEHENDVVWGLMMYPGTDQDCDNGGQCSEGVVPYEVGAGSIDDISTWIDGAGTCMFGTPTGEALRHVLTLDSMHDLTRNNFVLLVTDGAANCDDPQQDVINLTEETPPILTYVVGFGSGIDANQLTDMANNGGKPRLDPNGDVADPNYYLADDPLALDEAFETIVGDALGCDYDLSQPPADPDQLFIYFDGVAVPRDPTGQTGWDYVAAQGHLRFAGGACAALRQGIVEDLVIVYGCPIDNPPGTDPDAGTPDDVDGGTPGGGPDGGGPGSPDGGTPGGGPDGGGVVGGDAGVINPLDGGTPGGECNDRCVNGCAQEACLVDIGQCGGCRSDADCCLGSLCNEGTGQCIFIGG